MTVNATIGGGTIVEIVNNVEIKNPKGLGGLLLTDTNPANDKALDKVTLNAASIGDYVWEDKNNNGIQDAGEPGIGGVVVTLLNGGPNGTTASQTATDSMGKYSFTGLVPGNYAVEFGFDGMKYVISSKGQGSDQSVDSDINSIGKQLNSSAKTDIISLSSGENNNTIDAGLYIPTADLGVVKSHTMKYKTDESGKLMKDGLGNPIVEKFTAGETVTYTFEVTNNGSGSVGSFELIDTWPAYLGNVRDYTPSAGTYNATTKVWSVGAMLMGEKVTMTVKADVTANPPVEIENNVEIKNPKDPLGRSIKDGNPANDKSKDMIPTKKTADLTILKDTTNGTDLKAGGVVAYKIIASNLGPDDVVGASVKDMFDVALENVTWTCGKNIAIANNSATCTASGSGDIMDNAVNLKKGEEVIYIVKAKIKSSFEGGVIPNVVVIVTPPDVVDPNPKNNESKKDVEIKKEVDLEINKSHTPSTPQSGNKVTYKLIVKNNGPISVKKATIMDQIPDTILTVTWDCKVTRLGTDGDKLTKCYKETGTGNNIDLNADMMVNSEITITATGTIKVGTYGDITNTATVTPPTGTVDKNLGNNKSTATFNIPLPAPIVRTGGLMLSYSLIIALTITAYNLYKRRNEFDINL